MVGKIKSGAVAMVSFCLMSTAVWAADDDVSLGVEVTMLPMASSSAGTSLDFGEVYIDPGSNVTLEMDNAGTVTGALNAPTGTQVGTVNVERNAAMTVEASFPTSPVTLDCTGGTTITYYPESDNSLGNDCSTAANTSCDITVFGSLQIDQGISGENEITCSGTVSVDLYYSL